MVSVVVVVAFVAAALLFLVTVVVLPLCCCCYCRCVVVVVVVDAVALIVEYSVGDSGGNSGVLALVCVGMAAAVPAGTDACAVVKKNLDVKVLAVVLVLR